MEGSEPCTRGATGPGLVLFGLPETLIGDRDEVSVVGMSEMINDKTKARQEIMGCDFREHAFHIQCDWYVQEFRARRRKFLDKFVQCREVENGCLVDAGEPEESVDTSREKTEEVAEDCSCVASNGTETDSTGWPQTMLTI